MTREGKQRAVEKRRKKGFRDKRREEKGVIEMKIIRRGKSSDVKREGKYMMEMEKGRRNAKKGKNRTGGEAPFMKRDYKYDIRISNTF